MSDPNAHTPATVQLTPTSNDVDLPDHESEQSEEQDTRVENRQQRSSAHAVDADYMRSETSRTSSQFSSEADTGAIDSVQDANDKTSGTGNSLASSEMAAASISDRELSEDADAEMEEPEEEPVITMRYEHVATEDGHHMVVGREGKLNKCEDEPITTPGAVQGFGVLIVLEEDLEKGTLLVRQVSEVSPSIVPPKDSC